MMEHIKNAALFIIIGLLLQSISTWLQSTFVETFLTDNLITLILTLMAINTATVSVIVTKLRDISDNDGVDFSKSIKSMKDSITEQVVLLVIAVLTLILKSSLLLTTQWNATITVTTVILIATFLYAVQVLFDTAQGVFLIAYKENALLVKQGASKGQKTG